MVKNPPANAGDVGSIPGSGDPLEEGMVTYSVLCLENPHGQRSLVGYSPQDHTESDMTDVT